MTRKYCSECRSNKNVNDYDAYCPSCGTAFGTVVISSSSCGAVSKIIPSSAALAYSATKAMVEQADKSGGNVSLKVETKDIKVSLTYNSKEWSTRYS